MNVDNFVDCVDNLGGQLPSLREKAPVFNIFPLFADVENLCRSIFAAKKIGQFAYCNIVIISI